MQNFLLNNIIDNIDDVDFGILEKVKRKVSSK
ncbi:MAG: hypothetical protein ACJAVX_003870 [Pseudoalteromonas rhizosphaerae]|jgi:hypothetical protein